MPGMRRPLGYSLVFAVLAAAGIGTLSGCVEPTGCRKQQARVDVRWGNDGDYDRLRNYHRLRYDCITDGHVRDELGRAIGQSWVCTRCE